MFQTSKQPPAPNTFAPLGQHAANTVIQISVTPEQLGDLVRGAVRAELTGYTPPAPEGPTLPDFLTRRQTAETLQVSLTTLHEWAKDTDDRPAILVPLKVNGRVRYRREDVLALFKESRRFKTRKSHVR